MLLMFIVLTMTLKGTRTSNLIKKLFLFEKKENAHVVLSFACPTNELRDYLEKPVKRTSVQRFCRKLRLHRKQEQTEPHITSLLIRS